MSDVSALRSRRDGAPPLRHPARWTTLGLVAIVGVVSVLALDMEVSARAGALLIGAVAVTGALVLAAPYREVLLVVAVVGWAVALPLDGVRDPTVIVAQLSGAILLAVVAWHTAVVAESALRWDAAVASDADERAALLTTLLRLRSLDPDVVLMVLLDGAQQLGFGSTQLRLPDRHGGLVLAGSRPAPGEVPRPRLAPGEGLASIALLERRTCVVERYALHPHAMRPSRGLRGTVAAPVLVGDEVVAVLVARREQPGVTEMQRESIELLVEEAGRALVRARRYAADTATVRELRRLDELAHDFVSTVSHELRTPMTVINGLGKTLDRRWDDLSRARRDDLLRRIDGNTERLATMVRSLIDTSALERGELTVRPKAVDLGEVLGEVVGRLAPLLVGHEVVVTVPTATSVLADPPLLRHVVENLLTNAASYTPAGTRVVVVAEAIDHTVEVSVSDDGPGIPAEDLPHVLDRFYRAGTSAVQRPAGLGLGLALAHQIVHAHGSDLTVHSVVGEGTRFSFRLPMAAPLAPG